MATKRLAIPTVHDFDDCTSVLHGFELWIGPWEFGLLVRQSYSMSGPIHSVSWHTTMRGLLDYSIHGNHDIDKIVVNPNWVNLDMQGSLEDTFIEFYPQEDSVVFRATRHGFEYTSRKYRVDKIEEILESDYQEVPAIPTVLDHPQWVVAGEVFDATGHYVQPIGMTVRASSPKDAASIVENDPDLDPTYSVKIHTLQGPFRGLEEEE